MTPVPEQETARPLFTVFGSDVIGHPGNCLYPRRFEITGPAELKAAVSHDYVCAAYKNSYRNSENFLCADCLPVDCDNDHSEDPSDWIRPHDVAAAFPDVTFAVHYSRYNMREKNGKPARPKFHILFPIDPVSNATSYSDVKKTVNRIFPYFDTQALDAARFFFGTHDPQVEFYPGNRNLTEFLNFRLSPMPELTDSEYGVIEEGSRNSTLSVFAAKILKRYGDNKDTYSLFLKKADTCVPPLDDTELASIWRSAQNFYQRISKRPDYVPPEQYNAATADNFAFRPADDTDVGEARVFSDVCFNKLRYSKATDFLVYDGVCWEENSPAAHCTMHKFTDLQLTEATDAMTAAWNVLKANGAAELLEALSTKRALANMNEEQRKAYEWYETTKKYRQLTMSYRSSKNIQAVLKESRAMLAVMPHDLDADPFLLNTPAGTLDLRQGLTGLREHTSEDLITKITAVSPGAKGAAIWQDALNTIFCKDQQLIEYVQRIAGMALVGKVFSETLIIAYGDGRNGKSTFWNVLARVLGSYSGKISADALTVGCKRNVKPEIAEAKGKRLLIASELEEGMRLNTATVKQLCSTDPIEAEKKFKDPFHFEPSHSLVLYTNHLPRVGAMDDGTWRRLIVIPFHAKIEGSNDIKNYADYLFTNAGEAILAWMIEGAKLIIDAEFKLTPPACVTEACKAYKTDNDWLGQFLSDRCDVGENLSEKSGQLYIAYRQYCADCGMYTRSAADFNAALDNEGFTRKRKKTGHFVYGLSLQTDDYLN